MSAKLAEADQMTIEEFLGFYDSRPDGEKWELIEGKACMSPSPTDWHQIICGNVLQVLLSFKQAEHANWIPMIGIGTKVPISPNSLPQPDVFVKEGAVTGSHVTDDALVVFEVLSPSNTKSNQAWRRRVYASVPNCRHYVTISATSAEVTRYDRSTGWQGFSLTGLAAELDLPAIEVSIPLITIYRWTPLE
jgi:Uma2 family endonuclease